MTTFYINNPAESKPEINISRLYEIIAGKLLKNPDDPDMLITQMALLSDNGEQTNWPHLVCLAARAYNNNPNNLLAILHYGHALHRAGKFRQAASLYRQCVARNDPETHVHNLHHLGVAYHNMHEEEKALECYNQALALAPDRLDIQRDLAFSVLANGGLVRGLELLEVRKHLAEERLAWNQGELIQQRKLPEGFVQWQGESLEGKSIVVYHEDGIGDFFQMCRFIPLLYKAGAKCVQLTGALPSVLELVADNIAVDGIVPLDRPFGSDYVVGSMSVPWRCGVTLDQVNGKPYFKREAAELPQRGLINVGLVWSGNPKFKNDILRSMPLKTLCPLFEIPGVAFYSMQVGEANKEINKLGFDGFIGDLVPHIGGWRDTAALIKAMDVIVTVDTAVAHLAGALGVPVFILVTAAYDWRWNVKSTHTAWYDSARIFRQQTQDDWAPCIALAKLHLEDMVDARRSARQADRQCAGSECAA